MPSYNTHVTQPKLTRTHVPDSFVLVLSLFYGHTSFFLFFFITVPKFVNLKAKMFLFSAVNVM